MEEKGGRLWAELPHCYSSGRPGHGRKTAQPKRERVKSICESPKESSRRQTKFGDSDDFDSRSKENPDVSLEAAEVSADADAAEALQVMDHGGGGGLAGGGTGLGSAAREAEVKTQFVTREGLYKIVPTAEYTKPNRGTSATSGGGAGVGYANQVGSISGGAGSTSATGGGTSGHGPGGPAPVRVSFSQPAAATEVAELSNGGEPVAVGRRLIFNFGRELYVYPYRNTRKAPDLSKPLDKRVYKGTFPTCHDLVPDALTSTSPETLPLIVGFTQGQIQLVDPARKDHSKLYNEERLIDKSRVTCIKWVPGSATMFLVSFSSGALYVFNHELLCPPSAPIYQAFKHGEGFAVYTSKAKSTRNPLYKWSVGRGSVNEFAFSPCGHFLAVASQDGYLRIFNYDTMELTGVARSYFGGLTCVCWSPDGKYVAFGGEDDLVTIFSVGAKRVVARGQGHRSWVTRIAFDQYNMSYGDVPDGLDFSGSDEEGSSNPGTLGSSNSRYHHSNNNSRAKSAVTSSDQICDQTVTCYRLGSVGEDTQLCLWDLTAELLSKAKPTTTASSTSSLSASAELNHTNSFTPADPAAVAAGNHVTDSAITTATATPSEGNSNKSDKSLSQRLAALNFSEKKEHKRNFSLGKSDKSSTANSTLEKSAKSGSETTSLLPSSSSEYEYVRLGSPQCPRIVEVPLIDPLVCKKVSLERLTSLVFLEETLVTACQDGFVCTWARPGRSGGGVGYSVMCPGSPSGGGGTIV